MSTSPIERLIALEGDFEKLACEARDFLRSVQKVSASDDQVGSVRVLDVDRALKLYLDGVITENRLQEWADVLEMCDYVDYESGAEEAIADVLFRLSTPEINEPISHILAQKLRDELGAVR